MYGFNISNLLNNSSEIDNNNLNNNNVISDNSDLLNSSNNDVINNFNNRNRVYISNLNDDNNNYYRNLFRRIIDNSLGQSSQLESFFEDIKVVMNKERYRKNTFI